MDARDDLADAGSHSSLLSEICDVFSTLSDDYAGFLCGYEGTKSEDIVGGGWGWGTGYCGRSFRWVSQRDAPREREGPTCVLVMCCVFCGHDDEGGR